jgi:serine/threonine-protein kinase
MVMELLVGEPLDKRLERLGRITLQETARMLVQVCRALQRAHASGIIHRDLKPENIFLVHVPDDDDEIAKVLDFGIAKIKPGPGDKGLTSSTKTGAVLGTPYYMAPEQARGLRTIDHRADLWSLGVIAYKCVTGVLPFEGESVGDLLVKICTAAPPIPSLTMPGLPPAFDAWFARALEREPERRFQSASELAEALALAAGVTVRRGPLSSQTDRPAPALPSSRPRPPADGQTPPPAAALTSAPFVTSASPGSKRGSRGVFLGIVAAVILGGSAGVFAVVKLLAPARHVAQSPSSAAAIVAAPSAPPSPSVMPGASGASVTLSPIASTSASVAAPSVQPAPTKPRGGGGPRPTPAPPRPSPSPKPPSSPADPGY